MISKDWLTVEEEVVESQVTESTSSDSDGHGASTMYTAAIKFRYTLGGKIRDLRDERLQLLE